jgi:hypothetical protein
MAKPDIHIYLLSRLAFADVTDWRRIISQLREGRKNMYWSYKPLREGALRMAGRKGENPKPIYASVANLAQRAGGDRCRSANVAALETFEMIFLPQIERVNSNFMEGGERPVDFGGVRLIGGPHFSVIDAGGRERYVYLHPSRWKDQEVTAFCELLTVVAERRFRADARDIWFLDLRRGERVPWTAPKRLVRRKCQSAAEFLVAFQAANLAEDEG